MNTDVEEYHQLIPVFPTHEAGPIPTACDPEGTYPYPSYVETAQRPVLRKMRFVRIENDHLSAVVCPDTGGRLVSLKVKLPDGSTRETLFDSGVIRPVRILPRGAFIGGGIEISFPISHTPSLLEKVHGEYGTENKRAYVRFGERELRFGMYWTSEFSLGNDDRFLTQKSEFHNPGKHAYPWMSWSNAGVPCAPDTLLDFPNGPVLRHDQRLGEIDWESQGPKTQSDITNMTGFFWKNPDINAFGVFTPSLGVGLYHLADRNQMPGIKLWSDGMGKHEPWVNQYTTDKRQCLEIQAGPLIDQGIKAQLQPGETHRQTEYWFPTTKRLPLAELKHPEEHPWELPHYNWARPETVDLFLQLQQAWLDHKPSRIPPAPNLASNLWAPSGMDDLGKALEWAIQQSTPDADHWKFQLGAWLAARDNISGALAVLHDSSDPRAAAFSGVLLLTTEQDPAASVAEFERITEPAFLLHPQIVVAYDNALRQLKNTTTLDKRRQLHNQVAALDSDDLVEARAHLLFDEGHAEQALDLLMNHPWALVHQQYRRSRLARKIRESLNLPMEEPPNFMGEDNLAEFGAYQEYQHKSL